MIKFLYVMVALCLGASIGLMTDQAFGWAFACATLAQVYLLRIRIIELEAQNE